MRRNFTFLILFCSLMPLLSGCWDSLDIDKRATILAIAIDKAEPNKTDNEEGISHFLGDTQNDHEDMIRVTTQISVPGRIPLGPEVSGGENVNPVWINTTYGHTIDDALLNLQQQIADDLFLGHLRIVVISEDLAKKDINRFNDYFRRQPEVRRTMWLVISKEEAADYMKVAPELERIPSLYLTNMVENAVDLGKIPKGDIGFFWRIESSKGQDPYLPYLYIKDEENIKIDGLAYFKQSKMIGTIKPIEIGNLMSVLGETKGGYGGFITIPSTGEPILLQSKKRSRKLKTKINNGKPEIRLKVRYEGDIEEKESSKVSLNDPKVILEIEKQANKEIKKSLDSLIQKMQKDGSDIFGFGEHIRAKHPNYWNEKVKTKENWHTVFKDIDVDVELVSYIRRIGMETK